MNSEIIESLTKEGIYEGKIPKKIINYWDTNYFTNITTNKESIFKTEYNQYFYLIDNKDLFIYDFFYKDILSSISFIYKNQAKIRDIFAVLTLPKENDKSYTGHAGKWHTDGENSFAMMILLNDISINDTHMQFVMNEKTKNGKRLDNFDLTNPNIKNCIGEAGTFFLFSNGDHIHRQNLLSEKPRKTLHAIYLPENSSVFKKK